jgi:hypothetical protein
VIWLHRIRATLPDISPFWSEKHQVLLSRQRDRYLAGTGGGQGLVHAQRATAESVPPPHGDLAPKAVGVGHGDPITENAADTVNSLL